MREIEVTPACFSFIEDQDERTREKFFQLIEVIGELRIIHSNFIKKLESTNFYELRIKSGNEYRVIIFSIDHANFNECTKAIHGLFIKLMPLLQCPLEGNYSHKK